MDASGRATTFQREYQDAKEGLSKSFGYVSKNYRQHFSVARGQKSLVDRAVAAVLRAASGEATTLVAAKSPETFRSKAVRYTDWPSTDGDGTAPGNESFAAHEADPGHRNRR